MAWRGVACVALCVVCCVEHLRSTSDIFFFALSHVWLTDLGEIYKPPGSGQTLHTYEQGNTKTRLDFALVNEGFRSAVRDFEVVWRNLVPKRKGLKITLKNETDGQKAWVMRQPTTNNSWTSPIARKGRRRNMNTKPLWQMQGATSSH